MIILIQDNLHNATVGLIMNKTLLKLLANNTFSGNDTIPTGNKRSL